MKKNFFLDMETGDPDDVFALSLLATHPRSNLTGVTISPGGKDQVGIVKHVLERLGKNNTPIGVGNPKNDRPKVSEFHYKWLGKIENKEPDGSAQEVIKETLERHSEVHLITGAALTNVLAAKQSEIPRNAFFKEWTCQGGFAGENIVPSHLVLEKFMGRVTCPTYNLNGNPKAAKELLCENREYFKSIRLVSKNVCHGVFWTPEFDSSIPNGMHPGLDLIKDGMKCYFDKNKDGKALHDVIAAAAALSPEIGTWVSVLPYRANNGEWGCFGVHELTQEFSNLPVIITSLDNSAFRNSLFR